jgi:hypothetical protein
MLTEQEVHYFKTFGFLILRQVFDQDELKTINEEFEHALTTAYRHAPFDVRVGIGCPCWDRIRPFSRTCWKISGFAG